MRLASEFLKTAPSVCFRVAEFSDRSTASPELGVGGLDDVETLRAVWTPRPLGVSKAGPVGEPPKSDSERAGEKGRLSTRLCREG